MENLKTNLVGNHNRGKVFGVGINDTNESTKTKEYVLWHSMLRRCYSEVYQKSKPRYVGCSVAEEWKYFSKFKRDVVNIPFFNMACASDYQMDKDILISGNKIYSKETVCFVPKEINSALIKKDGIANGCLIGVYEDKPTGRFRPSITVGVLNNYRKAFNLKCIYDSEYEAHQAYVTCKKAYLTDLANKYNGEIDERTYKALINYEIA